MAIVEWPVPQINGTKRIIFSVDLNDGLCEEKLEIDQVVWDRIARSADYADFWRSTPNASPNTCERHVRPDGTFYCLIGFENREGATMFKLRFL